MCSNHRYAVEIIRVRALRLREGSRIALLPYICRSLGCRPSRSPARESGVMLPTVKRGLRARNGPMGLCVALLVAVAGLLVIALGCGSASEEQTVAPLKIGLLLDFTGSPEASADRKRAFDLAIRHVNEGGGVLGIPVEGVAADATRDPAVAVEAARRLVEVEGVHAIVGPNASAASLQSLAERVWDVPYPHDQPFGHLSATDRRR